MPEWKQAEELKSALGGRLDISMGCIRTTITTGLQKASGISKTSFSVMPKRYFCVIFISQICPGEH